MAARVLAQGCLLLTLHGCASNTKKSGPYLPKSEEKRLTQIELDRANKAQTDSVDFYENTTCNADGAKKGEKTWRNIALKYRRYLAVSIARNEGAQTIVELGNGCSPVCRHDPDFTYILIDPQANSLPIECKKTTIIKKPFYEVNFAELNIQSPFALVALGINYKKVAIIKELDKKSHFLQEATQNAQVAIFESSFLKSSQHDQLIEMTKVAAQSGLKEDINVRFNLKNTYFPSIDDYYRHFVVYLKPGL